MSTTQTTPRAIVREWVAAYVAAHPEVDPGALAGAARERFAGDVEFAQALVEWALTDVVRAEAKRATATPDRVPLSGGRSITREALARRASGGPWAEWRERYRLIRSDGQLVELPDMTREHLLDALETRKSIAREAIVSVRFLGLLAENIGPTQRVRDVFTPDQLVQVERAAANGRRS